MAKRRGASGNWKLEIRFLGLHIESWHDGLLRGRPEPVVLLAPFFVGAEGAQCLGRLNCRVSVRGGARPPLFAEAPGSAPQMRVKFTTRPVAGGTTDFHLALLGLAFEEDGGVDIERITHRLLEGGEWWPWRLDDTIPSPLPLPEFVRQSPMQPPHAESVSLLQGNSNVEETVSSDKYVGASAATLRGQPSTTQWNMRFQSRDGRNDWTAAIEVCLKN